jgi:hypothetical protein
LNGYVKNHPLTLQRQKQKTQVNIAAWIERNNDTTESFKQAYKRLMAYFKKNPDEAVADPILNAQDIPDRPYRMNSVKIEGDRASVTLKTEDWPRDLVQMGLIKLDDKWSIDSINDINRKK